MSSQLTDSFSRQRVTLVIIKLPRCANVYSVNDGLTSFCTASKLPGDECHNYFHTCQAQANFVKITVDWKICTKGVTPFPGEEYWEPILDKVSLIPTEILETKFVKSRLDFKLLNYRASTVSSEQKVGGDYYAKNRTTIEGTRLRKLLARCPNLKGNIVEQYEGALGDTFADYEGTFKGNLWNFSQNAEGDVTAEAEDLLTKMEDKANEIPPRVDGKLVNDITAAAIALTLDNPTEYPAAPNYIFLGSGETGELIKYGAKDDTTGVFSTLSRGQEGTTASEFQAGEKVKRVQWWPFQNPFDIALDILDQCGLTPFVNVASFTAAKTFPEVDVNHSAFITEPTRANILYNELMKPLDTSTWVGEDLTVNVKRNVNTPGQTAPELTESGNIWKDTQKVNLNDKSVRNAGTLAWNHIPGRNPKEELSYSRGNVYVNTNSTSANDRNQVLLEPMMSRFIRFGDTAEEIVEAWALKALARYIRRRTHAQAIIDFKVEFKDFQRKTGETVELTTDKIEDITGAGLTGALFMLIRRAPGGKDIALRAIREPQIGYGVWAPDRLAGVAFADADADDQRSYGAWANDNGRIPDGTPYGAEGKVWY